MKDRIWIIPHTHYDAAVFKTRAEYLDIGLPNILLALHTLQADPRYRFVLDQVCYIRPFLERYPEQADLFREMIAQGRLQITCGMDSMADVNMPSGESFIRQVLYGKGFCREQLNIEVTCGWALDTFGHHPQMPQLLRKAGFDSYWLARGTPDLSAPSEFYWQGIDGSRVLCVWMPYNYGLFYGVPQNQPELAAWLATRYALLKPYAATGHIAGLSGADLTAPEPHLPDMVDAFNRTGGAAFDLAVATPGEYLAALNSAVEHDDDLRVLHGDFNPLFQGCYSSRIEVKQWNRELERLLSTAETSEAVAAYLGLPINPDAVWQAWEPVLFNQFHDLMGGVQVDKVFDDTMRSYYYARRLAQEIVDTRLESITRQIRTEGEGIPLVVFNTLGWERSDVAEAEVSFTDAGILSMGLVDAAGHMVSHQVLEQERYGDGGIKRARLLFVARNVPPVGYAVYHVVANPTEATAQNAPGCSSGSGQRMNLPNVTGQRLVEKRGFIANEHYRLEFDMWTGALVSLQATPGGWEAIRDGLGNVVAREHDGGDFWELNGSLRAAVSAINDRDQPPPGPGQAELSSDQVGDGLLYHGAVMAEFHISHPYGRGWFDSTVRIYQGLPRIDFHTEILNNDEWVRYRVLFPTTMPEGTVTHEIPFGAIERPGREFPAQNWIDYSNGGHGLALLNRGLPGNNVDDGVMMLSLLRATQIVAYGGGGYEAGVGSASGQEKGKRLAFDYALVPHDGDWRDGRIYRSGLEFNHPLLVQRAGPHPGRLPARWGLLNVSAPNAVVSAVKPGRDGALIVRVYEAEGRATTGVSLRLACSLEEAAETNLLEDEQALLSVEGDAISFDLGPFEIKTFKLRLRP